jgi:proteasome lid subunit RPN8/RPN11
MRFWRSGHKKAGVLDAAAAGAGATAGHGRATPLSNARVGAPNINRDLGRRDIELAYGRVFLPSLVIDHTELMLRQHGLAGEEGFGVLAGALAGGDAFVSTVVIPRMESDGQFHGEISEETVGKMLERLDHLDLVPIAQIHSHPQTAFLSEIDAERPVIAVPGFLSIVIPNFAFIDLADVELWRVYEFQARRRWRELDGAERAERLVIDPSILQVG